MIRLLEELKTRRVYQSAAIYAVAAWGVAQVVDFVAERLFLPDWVPTITAIVFVVGFPIAIFLAWVFDVGPDGIRRTTAGSIRGVTSLTLAFVMLIGGTALIYSIVWPARDHTPEDTAGPPLNSVAVLPFTLQGDSEANFLSDGVAEEILYALNSLRDLHVAARTSTFALAGRGATLEEISSTLNVRHVLEGSIRIAGERLSVYVNLVRADSGYSLWSETYDRQATDLIAIQDEIANRIARAVRAEVGNASVSGVPRFRANTADAEAYSLYLQGRHLWHQRGAENILAALAFFNGAVDRDPDFAAAWAGLASAYLTSGTYGAVVEGHFRRAQSAAKKAVDLDPALGEPYGTLAQIEFNAHRYEAGLAFIEKGIEIEPWNSSLRLWYGTHLLGIGRANAAMNQVGPVIERDPAYPVLRANFGFSNFMSGNFRVAKENFDSAWNMGFRALFAWRGTQYLNIARGDYDAATAWVDEMPIRNREVFGDIATLERAWIAAASEASQDAHNIFVELMLEMVEGNRINRTHAAVLLASVGESDYALDIYISLAEAGHHIDRGSLWIPLTASVRTNERFAELATWLEWPAYWAAVEWPDACGPDEELAVRCYR